MPKGKKLIKNLEILVFDESAQREEKIQKEGFEAMHMTAITMTKDEYQKIRLNPFSGYSHTFIYEDFDYTLQITEDYPYDESENGSFIRAFFEAEHRLHMLIHYIHIHKILLDPLYVIIRDKNKNILGYAFLERRRGAFVGGKSADSHESLLAATEEEMEHMLKDKPIKKKT